jgi:hypothetical protein
VPRVWSRGDRVVYERDPMLFGVMSVCGPVNGHGLVTCRIMDKSLRDPFELFAPGHLVEAPGPSVDDVVTQAGLRKPA